MKQRQEGVVLVVAMIVLLIMSGLAVGLIQQSKRELAQVAYQSAEVDLRAAAESCIENALSWLEVEGATEPPCKDQNIGSQCGSTLTGKLSDWSSSDDNGLMQAKSEDYSYSCKVFVASSEELNSSGGAGFEVSKSQAYGTINTLTKYRYRVKSKASSNDGGVSEIEVNVGMVY